MSLMFMFLRAFIMELLVRRQSTLHVNQTFLRIASGLLGMLEQSSRRFETRSDKHRSNDHLALAVVDCPFWGTVLSLSDAKAGGVQEVAGS